MRLTRFAAINVGKSLMYFRARKRYLMLYETINCHDKNRSQLLAYIEKNSKIVRDKMDENVANFRILELPALNVKLAKLED
jgi:hypothetical protein